MLCVLLDQLVTYFLHTLFSGNGVDSKLTILVWVTVALQDNWRIEV